MGELAGDRALFDFRWNEALRRDAAGAPFLSSRFVAAQGAGVVLLDLRRPEEAEGALGHIPGSRFVDPARVEETAPGRALVLVSADGSLAAPVAARAEAAGRRVAALSGGLSGWRQSGLRTSRSPVTEPVNRSPEAGAAPAGPITADEIRAHIGDPSAVRWVKLAAVFGRWHVSCIDGRDGRGVIGSPGGNAGEFLLALAALEKVIGRSLAEDEVRRTFLAHLDTFGDFYFHTDGHAAEALLANLKTDGRFGEEVSGVEDLEGLGELLLRPPPSCRAALLEHLVDPATVGCGHVRLMMQREEEYGIRAGLVRDFIRTLFEQLWAGANEVVYTVLPGGHEEAAVLTIHLQEEIWGLSFLPLVSPAVSGRQVFVSHPDVAAHLRRAIVSFHARGLGPVALGPGEVDDFHAAVDELAGRQLAATVGHLAKGLPMFDVVFAPDGSFRVAEG